MFDLEWHLEGGVNIISGGNGSGKSTLLRGIGIKLLGGELSSLRGAPIDSINIESNEKIEPSDVIVVGREGREIKVSEAQNNCITEQKFSIFCSIISRLFGDNHKRIVNEYKGEGMTLNDLTFKLYHKRLDRDIDIEYQWLSTGEQLAISLFWAVISRPDASILILDEPEISLSIEWQKTFLENILELNENLQIIVATHSPALIMRGWIDRVTEIEDITVNS